MASAIMLLIFLFVLGTGLGTILYVSKNSRNFNLMAGWSLFFYLILAIATLECIVDVLPAK